MALDETARPARARIWRLTLILVGVLTVLRVVALFVTPLELYPDEAQYWLWSRHLDFGYFSKPPVIAWLIWATTRIGGDAEAWLRIGSPLINAGTALVVSRIATRLYGAERGGSWVGPAALCRSDYRRGRSASARGRCLGFRCCAPAAALSRANL